MLECVKADIISRLQKIMNKTETFVPITDKKLLEDNNRMIQDHKNGKSKDLIQYVMTKVQTQTVGECFG